MTESLHFIRPWWWAAMPISLLIAAMVWYLRDTRLAWRGIIAPPLLDALLVRGQHHRRLVPASLLALLAVVTPLALSGPTWQREPSPFAEETAAVVIVVEATESMLTEDVAPTRSERASQKIADFIERRPGTDTALVAFCGSAHVAMPLTRDAAVVAQLARALGPEIMPVDGEAAAEALALANDEIKRAGRAGSILLISDGVSEPDAEAIATSNSVPVHVLAISTDAPPASLKRIARATGGTLAAVTPDDADVTQLASRTQRNVGRVAAAEGEGRWRDFGYWLVPFIALVTLAWSRRGWAIGYGSVHAPGGDA